jgi:hypothetical protein
MAAYRGAIELNPTYSRGVDNLAPCQQAQLAIRV